MLLTEVDVVLAGHPREGDVLRVEGVAVTRSHMYSPSSQLDLYRELPRLYRGSLSLMFIVNVYSLLVANSSCSS